MLKGGAAGVLCCGILCIGEASSVNMILRLTGVLGGDIIMVGLVGSIGEIGTDAAVVGKNTLVSVAGGTMGEHSNRRDVEGILTAITESDWCILRKSDCKIII